MLTQAKVREALDYDPDTGIFIWKQRPLSHFATEAAGRIWNVKFPGKRAGHTKANGYVYIHVFGHRVRAHRLAFLYVHGRMPANELDHVNRVKHDNRIANLKEATHRENILNQCVSRKKTPVLIGVSWHSRDCKWQVRIATDSGQKHLGYFDCFSEAVAARKAAEREHGYVT